MYSQIEVKFASSHNRNSVGLEACWKRAAETDVYWVCFHRSLRICMQIFFDLRERARAKRGERTRSATGGGEKKAPAIQTYSYRIVVAKRNFFVME